MHGKRIRKIVSIDIFLLTFLCICLHCCAFVLCLYCCAFIYITVHLFTLHCCAFVYIPVHLFTLLCICLYCCTFVYITVHLFTLLFVHSSLCELWKERCLQFSFPAYHSINPKWLHMLVALGSMEWVHNIVHLFLFPLFLLQIPTAIPFKNSLMFHKSTCVKKRTHTSALWPETLEHLMTLTNAPVKQVLPHINSKWL